MRTAGKQGVGARLAGGTTVQVRVVLTASESLALHQTASESRETVEEFVRRQVISVLSRAVDRPHGSAHVRARRRE